MVRQGHHDTVFVRTTESGMTGICTQISSLSIELQVCLRILDESSEDDESGYRKYSMQF